MPDYHPPPLDRKITLRNPENEPVATTDEYDIPITDPVWGDIVWANRRDRAPFTEVNEGVLVRTSLVVFTVRKKDSVTANYEVVDGDEVFSMVGKPITRGGINGGLVTEFLELHCESRSV